MLHQRQRVLLERTGSYVLGPGAMMRRPAAAIPTGAMAALCDSALDKPVLAAAGDYGWGVRSDDEGHLDYYLCQQLQPGPGSGSGAVTALRDLHRTAFALRATRRELKRRGPATARRCSCDVQFPPQRPLPKDRA